MLTFQGQSAVLWFSTIPHLSECIFEIYVLLQSKGGTDPEFCELLGDTRVKCDLPTTKEVFIDI